MVDIIIPCKNSQATLNRTLCSLAAQVGIEQCTVTLVNKEGDSNYTAEIERFKGLLNIQEITYPVFNGVGGARQYGLDHTSEPYVMFIDSDDILYNNLVLQTLFKPFTENKDQHAVYGEIIELNNKKLTPIKANHFIWLHGAMFSRKFLNEKTIKFFPNSSGEDAGFNLQVRALSNVDNVTFINSPMYLWTDWNADNRINTREFAFFESKEGLVDNIIFAMENIKAHADIAVVKQESITALCSLFFQYQTAVLKYPDKNDIFITWCKRYYNNIYRFFEKDITKIELEYTYFELKKEFFKNGNFKVFDVEIYDFIKLLKETVNE